MLRAARAVPALHRHAAWPAPPLGALRHAQRCLCAAPLTRQHHCSPTPALFTAPGPTSANGAARKTPINLELNHGHMLSAGVQGDGAGQRSSRLRVPAGRESSCDTPVQGPRPPATHPGPALTSRPRMEESKRSRRRLLRERCREASTARSAHGSGGGPTPHPAVSRLHLGKQPCPYPLLTVTKPWESSSSSLLCSWITTTSSSSSIRLCLQDRAQSGSATLWLMFTTPHCAHSQVQAAAQTKAQEALGGYMLLPAGRSVGQVGAL